MLQPIDHIFYAAGEHLHNTIRTRFVLTEPVEPMTLAQAAAYAASCYPYFAVKLVRRGEDFFLAANDAPYVITKGEAPLPLGGEESNFHLVSFSYAGCILYVNNVHFHTDGNGLFPFLWVLLHRYLSLRHPEASIPPSPYFKPERGDPKDPYPSQPLPFRPFGRNRRPQEVFRLPGQPQGYESLDDWTSFRLHIRQKDLMDFASSADGSPATFVASLLYRAIVQVHPENRLPVVCGMQHQFRGALHAPFSHRCHVSILPILFPDKLRDRPIDRLNTMARGTLLIAADDANDIPTINAHIHNRERLRTMTLAEKQAFMRSQVPDYIGTNTFEVSYTGRVTWGGLEQYVQSVSPYLDMSLSGGLSAEIFSVGDRFNLNFMQRSADPAYVDALCRQLDALAIPFKREAAEHFEIPLLRLPQEECGDV